MKTSPTAPPARSRRLSHLLGLSLALLAGACSSAPALPESQRLLNAVEAEIGEASCKSDTQCHSLGVGAKACGGPESYRAWSSLASDGKKLKALAAQQATARKAENEKSGLMSNCAIEADPGAQCLQGRCTLRPRAGAPMSAV